MKPSPLPHHEEAQRVTDEWSDGPLRFRLVERGGMYRLETWGLYRWEVAEGGLQVLARRLAALQRHQVASITSIETRAAKAR